MQAIQNGAAALRQAEPVGPTAGPMELNEDRFGTFSD